MAQFSTSHQPAKAGRKPGSKNKRSQFSDTLTTEAIRQLTLAVEQGEQWAVDTVLKRTHPSLKPITPTESLDGEFLKARTFEISELQARIEALEGLPNG
jgi:hypothetical protein